MAFPTNPNDGDVFITGNGTKRVWSAANGVWTKPEGITSSDEGTIDSLSKLWIGSKVSFNDLSELDDDIVYFIKG